jgi:hypothetical protein
MIVAVAEAFAAEQGLRYDDNVTSCDESARPPG